MGIYLDAAYVALKNNDKPMTASEIIDYALHNRYLDTINTQTPQSIMRARLSTDLLHYGKNSRFIRTQRGFFALREWHMPEYETKHQVKRIPSEELVLVVKTDLIDNIGKFQGINAKYEDFIKHTLHSGNISFIPRLNAETNTYYKQILSYVIIKCEGKILRFQRGNYTNVDSLLKGRYSIGFGGHITNNDVKISSHNSGIFDYGYSYGVLRELNEELKFSKPIKNIPPIIGILNDDSSNMGLKHIAFIHLLELQNLEVYSNEKSINQTKFVSQDELIEEYEKFEYWSKLCIKKFFLKKFRLKANYHPIKKKLKITKDERNLVIIGSVGSGKTEICKYLKRYNFEHISTSNIIKKILNISFDSDRKEVQNLTYEFIKKPQSTEFFAREIYKKMNKYKKNVIDGVRNIDTFINLKKLVNDHLPLIFVQTTPDDAFRFFQKREDNRINFNDFVNYLSHPVESEVPYFAKEANLIFYNYGDLNSLMKTVEEYFGDP